MDRKLRYAMVGGGPGAFIVVTQDFHAFAAAIRRKLVLEIAGMSPPDRVLPNERRLAQSHGRIPLSALRDWVPPCDEGERRFQGTRFDEW